MDRKFIILELKHKTEQKLVTSLRRLVEFENISKSLSKNEYPTDFVYFYSDSDHNAEPNFSVAYSQDYDPAVPAIRSGLIAKGIFGENFYYFDSRGASPQY